MAKRDDLLATFENNYEAAKTKESEELHNAIGVVLQEHRASLQNVLFVLELVKFELLRAKYEEIMGTVKLSNKIPLPIMKEKPKEE